VRSERLTLARELHDVISHAVVLMVVQAGAAEALYASKPLAARRPLDLVRGTAEATLEELERLLVATRDDDSGSAVVAPGTRSVTALVARMRAGGLDVDFAQQRNLADVPSATIYRIVQETLTTALRHAPRRRDRGRGRRRRARRGSRRAPRLRPDRRERAGAPSGRHHLRRDRDATALASACTRTYPPSIER
jgi:hypothetical protein